MSELPLKEAIEILTQEKKKVELKLAKAYDSFCLYPNEADQNDWDRFSALDSAFEMAISALEQLNNVPSVQPRSGKWIVINKFEDCCYAKCNQCNVTQLFYYNKPLTNFCPNCGAKMEGEE